LRKIFQECLHSTVDALDKNLQSLNNKRRKVMLFGDFNINLSFNKTLFPVADYLHLIDSNGFTSLIDKPT